MIVVDKAGVSEEVAIDALLSSPASGEAVAPASQIDKTATCEVESSFVALSSVAGCGLGIAALEDRTPDRGLRKADDVFGQAREWRAQVGKLSLAAFS